MRASIGAALAVALAVTVCGAPARAAAQRLPEDSLQVALDRIVADGSASAIAEVRGGDRVWRGTSGTARLDGGGPAPVDGRFRAGSLTKTFVAAVVLQLVAERRVQLTDEVARWLPGVLPARHRITVAQLLGHGSGLHEYGDRLIDEDGLPVWRYRTWRPAQLVRLANPERLDFQPGTKTAYSNTDYIVLGMLIERVTGRPYAAEVERRVLRPSGLRGTSLPGTSVGLPAPHAHGYATVASTGRVVDVTRLNPSMAGAAGEIVSTTADLNRFHRDLLAGRLLPPAQLRAMKDSGFGLESARLACGVTVHGHGGGIPGYFTISFTSDDTSRQVTLSVARRSGDPSGTAFQFLQQAVCG